MNEMIQSGNLSEKHCHLQEISMFTSIFGEISEDPLRGITNLHKRFPTAVFLQEKIQNSVSGRQAYNSYLGKHNVGKGTGGIAGGKTLPRPDSVNYLEISPSNWYKKVQVPLVYDDVVVNYVETLQKIIPEVTNLKIVSENSITMFASVCFNQKAISPGICMCRGGFRQVQKVRINLSNN